MKDKKEHLNIDLEFLDKEKEAQKGPSPSADAESSSETRPSTVPVSTGYKRNWRNIMIIGGVGLFIIWAIASSDDSSSPSSNYVPPATNQVRNTSADNDYVEYGEYRCTQYHYNKAVALSPSESEQTLTSAQSSMEFRAGELERLQREIEYSYVNEYSSQWEIDDYNDKIDTYNSKLAAYKRDATALDSRIDRFNAQVAARNNYLTQNCTPR